MIPSLSGKAKEAYVNLSIEDSQHYDKLKEAILDKYQINAETYRVKFRTSTRQEDQSVTEWVNELDHQFSGWIKYSNVKEDDAKGIKEIMIIEQAIRHLPSDLAVHLRDKQIQTSKTLAKEADAFVVNRGGKEYWKRARRTELQSSNSSMTQERQELNAAARVYRPPIVCFKCGNPGHVSKFCRQYTTPGEKRCYNCGQFGHLQNGCPHRNNWRGSREGGEETRSVFNCASVRQQNLVMSRLEKCMVEGKVQGKSVKILRDSACTQSAIKADLVPQKCYLKGKWVTVSGVGGTVEVPLAEVELECELVSGKVEVAVIKGLQQDFLLGHDIDSHCGEAIKRDICILTRAQARKEIEEFKQGEIEIREYMEQQNNENPQKETEQLNPSPQVGSGTTIGVESVGEEIDQMLTLTKEEIIQKQKADSTLKGVRDRVVTGDQLEKYRVGFFYKDGILMRKWSSSQQGGTKSQTAFCKSALQIVVPHECRSNILCMAHDMSGHLGVEKTKD